MRNKEITFLAMVLLIGLMLTGCATGYSHGYSRYNYPYYDYPYNDYGYGFHGLPGYPEYPGGNR
jgi:hypothetical protein